MRGLEPEVHLVVDVMLPTERLVDALTAFRDEFPTVALRLRVEALGAVTQLVLDGVAGIGISGPMPGLAAHPAIEPIRVGEVELVSVAAPKHPLAKAGRNLHAAMREHIQLVLSDRSELTKSVDFAVVSPRTWRLSDLGAKLLLLRAGIGWGNMPRPMVQEDLDSGSLVRLDPPGALAFTYRFEAIYRSDAPHGPAGSWLIERFRSQATPQQIKPEPRRPTKPATLRRQKSQARRKSRK